jgi:hypothetical protein
MNQHLGCTMNSIHFLGKSQGPRNVQFGNTASMLQETSFRARALMAQLGNVCTNEDTMHFLLGEGTSKDLEVFPGADLFMKLSI